jgi:hypothetical protein
MLQSLKASRKRTLFQNARQRSARQIGQERDIFNAHYKMRYFFSTRALEGFDLEIIEREKVYRQKDQEL